MHLEREGRNLSERNIHRELNLFRILVNANIGTQTHVTEFTGFTEKSLLAKMVVTYGVDDLDK